MVARCKTTYKRIYANAKAGLHFAIKKKNKQTNLDAIWQTADALFKQTWLTRHHMLCYSLRVLASQLFLHNRRSTHTQSQRASIWSPPVWLDSAICEHYWISTGRTNRTDAAGSAGGQSQTAGQSIRTRDLGNIGKPAVSLCLWQQVFVNIQCNKLWLRPVGKRCRIVIAGFECRKLEDMAEKNVAFKATPSLFYPKIIVSQLFLWNYWHNAPDRAVIGWNNVGCLPSTLAQEHAIAFTATQHQQSTSTCPAMRSLLTSLCMFIIGRE